MEKNRKLFAFAIASKQNDDSANKLHPKQDKWSAQNGVAAAGCTYVKKYDDVTFSPFSSGDGQIFC